MICLTAGRDPIPGYKVPEPAEYYAEHPDELVTELETNVFPKLDKYSMSAAVTESGTVAVTIDSAHYAAGRSALLRYFDSSLLDIQREP